MFGNYLIGLREGLEAALVVSILIAYLVRTGRASQEAFGGFMSIFAVGLVTWMIFWMRRAARGLSSELRGRLDAAVAIGGTAVVTVAFISVAREGLETSLFFWTAAQAAGSTMVPLGGFLLGLGTAVALGVAFYRGALRINLAKFFTWTGALLIVVAAGVLSYGIHDLQEAGILPGLNNLLFDVSAQVPPDSWYGSLLKGLFNFSAQTTVLQAVAWLAYLVPTLILYLRPARAKAPAPVPVAAA
jgi:high-affinity iron transporter